MIKWKLPWRKCDHRFKADDVINLNVDPRCMRCGKLFSVINDGQRYRFKQCSEQEFKLERR